MWEYMRSLNPDLPVEFPGMEWCHEKMGMHWEEVFFLQWMEVFFEEDPGNQEYFREYRAVELKKWALLIEATGERIKNPFSL